MKVILLQTDIYWADPVLNLIHIGKILEGYAEENVDLFILPEMFSTGFCTNPDKVAESVEGPTVRWMKSKAGEYNCAIAGSISIEEEGRFYNRLFFVYPDGEIHWYDKRHLFTYGGEREFYTAGKERVVVKFRGVRFLLGICYDLRFPVWSRNRGDYDVAIYVASWPSSRLVAWKALLQARAIENQCYVLGVNRVGKDFNCSYCGGTVAFDPYGNILAACEDGKSSQAKVIIKLSDLESLRKKFPVLNDADSFTLN